MFLRGICAEKSDVKVGRFEGEMVKKWCHVAKPESDTETKTRAETSFRDGSGGLVVVLVSVRVAMISMSSSEDLVWRGESEASSTCFLELDAEGAWNTMQG